MEQWPQVLAYLNYHKLIVFVMVFILISRLEPGNNSLVLFGTCDWLLLAIIIITIITAYQITSSKCALR